MCPNLGLHHQALLSSYPTIDRVCTIECRFLATLNDEASSSSKQTLCLSFPCPMASFIFSTSLIRYRHCAQFPSLADILAASSTKFSNSNDKKKITLYDSGDSNRLPVFPHCNHMFFANLIINDIHDCSEIPGHESLCQPF
ncbi:hypothetical protein EAF00_005150 [Botryotinia globosa]|nr:hypothetical protein EAF00_005150 [Botryotinia globosa]